MDERERFQFYFRQHWIRLLGPLAWMIILSIVILGIGYLSFFSVHINDPSSRHAVLLLLFACFMFVHLRFLVRFYAHWLHIIIVTDRKVHRIKKTLLAFDDHQTVDLWTVQDINKRQHGIIQYLFNFGTIVLEAQDTQIRLHFIPHVDRMHQRFSHLREMAREHGMRRDVASS